MGQILHRGATTTEAIRRPLGGEIGPLLAVVINQQVISEEVLSLIRQLLRGDVPEAFAAYNIRPVL